jgi:hypothetical protein
MMVPKWMIGACVAVAAMAIGVEAEANPTINAPGQSLGFAPASVQVTNQSSKPVKVTYVWNKNQAEVVVAPNSVGATNYNNLPVVITGTEDSSVSVKVGKLPARKFKISGNEVRKLYERSGFTPEEAAVVIDVRVNKHGVVELRRLYLRKQNPA